MPRKRVFSERCVCVSRNMTATYVTTCITQQQQQWPPPCVPCVRCYVEVHPSVGMNSGPGQSGLRQSTVCLSNVNSPLFHLFFLSFSFLFHSHSLSLCVSSTVPLNHLSLSPCPCLSVSSLTLHYLFLSLFLKSLRLKSKCSLRPLLGQILAKKRPYQINKIICVSWL